MRLRELVAQRLEMPLESGILGLSLVVKRRGKGYRLDQGQNLLPFLERVYALGRIPDSGGPLAHLRPDEDQSIARLVFAHSKIGLPSGLLIPTINLSLQFRLEHTRLELLIETHQSPPATQREGHPRGRSGQPFAEGLLHHVPTGQAM